MTSSKSNQSEADKTSHASRIAQVNLFETCLIVCVLFFVCWVTVQAAILLYMLDIYPDLSGDHYTSGRLLILFNSCVNPYVYSLRYREFKVQLRILLGCGSITSAPSQGVELSVKPAHTSDKKT